MRCPNHTYTYTYIYIHMCIYIYTHPYCSQGVLQLENYPNQLCEVLVLPRLPASEPESPQAMRWTVEGFSGYVQKIGAEGLGLRVVEGLGSQANVDSVIQAGGF